MEGARKRVQWSLRIFHGSGVLFACGFRYFSPLVVVMGVVFTYVLQGLLHQSTLGNFFQDKL